jgi:hypothetical protein
VKYPNNGFIYAASVNKAYITSARYSAISLKDYWPEAHVTLFTHKEWVEESDSSIFDSIITEDEVQELPHSIRAKMWACARSPYKLTCYIDADCEIVHEDIRNIFDCHDPANNITITRARPYSASIDPKWDGGELTDHCGLYIFDDDNRTRTFMQRWFEYYIMQTNFSEDIPVPDERFRPFDMYTYWFLMNKTEFAIKRGYFPHPDARWQNIFNYNEDELDGQEIVVTHRPIPRDMQEHGTGIY